MYRQYDPEQDETEDVEYQREAGMFGEMPHGGMQGQGMDTQYGGMQGQGMPFPYGVMQGQGMPMQINGRPMICYPMMYGAPMGAPMGVPRVGQTGGYEDSEMEQYGETPQYPGMYRQYGGMHYHYRPRPHYNYYHRPRPYFYPYLPIHPFYPFYSPYHREEEYDYGDY